MDAATNKLNGVFVYLHDILVASKSMQEHMWHLRALFAALKEFGLMINSD